MRRIGDLAIAYENLSKEKEIEILRCNLQTFECEKERFNGDVTLHADISNFCHFFNGTQKTIKLVAKLSVNMNDNNEFTLAYHNARGNATSHTLKTISGKVSVKDQISIITLKPGDDLTVLLLGLDKTSKDNATLVLSTYKPSKQQTTKTTSRNMTNFSSMLLFIFLIIVVLSLT
jgi:hypothetical protein